MTDAITILHIGFPKTATTTLQSVLQRAPDCAYVGKGLREALEPSLSLDVAGAVLFADTRRFEEMRPALAECLAEQARAAGRLVISDEAFSFAEHMKIGRQWQRQVVSDHDVVAARLAALCPGAKVMISVRNQFTFLESFYRQSLKGEGIDLSFDTFVTRELEALPHRSMLHLLRYDEVFEAYATRFGADNLLVSLYEDYKVDFGVYLDAVAAFCGLNGERLRTLWGGRHDNRARKSRDGDVVQLARRVIPAPLRAALPQGAKAAFRQATEKPLESADFSAPQRAEIGAYFALPNRRFAERAGLALGPHGYPLESAG